MLQKLISSLSNRDFALLTSKIDSINSEKHLEVLNSYRTGNLSDRELSKRLNIKFSTFYTIKSRLLDKVQYFLFSNVEDEPSELILNIARIEQLVYDTPKEIAISILKKLEKELLENDKVSELVDVYKALKKLHVNTPKYYEYSKSYNKHVAFALAQDKAEDLLSQFSSTLNSFYLTRDELEFIKLSLYRKEMDDTCRIYSSHRLKIFKNFLEIQFSLFFLTTEEHTHYVEQLLQESSEILEKYRNDEVYKHLLGGLDFLYFEYYCHLKSPNKAILYFEKIVKERSTLIFLNHTCFAAHFFITKVEFSNASTGMNLPKSNIDFKPIVQIDEDNLTEFILYNYNVAAELFYLEKYSEAIQTLNSLFHEISVKHIMFIEVELKLFLALLYTFNCEEDQAAITMRNITRKIKEDSSNEKFSNTIHFIKFLKAYAKRQITKSTMLYLLFKNNNKGRYKMFEFLALNDKILSVLDKHTK